MADAAGVTIIQATEGERSEATDIIREYLKTIREYVGDAEVSADVLRHTSGGDAALFLARSARGVVGCVTTHRLATLDGAFEIKRLYVLPSMRRTGVAEALMAAAERYAKAQCARRIVLDTKETMDAARRLYERLGYRTIPRYHDRPDITIFMGKEL